MKSNVGFLSRVCILVLDLAISVTVPFLVVNVAFLFFNLESFFILYIVLLLIGAFGIMFVQESVFGVSIGGISFGIEILDNNGNHRPRGFTFRNSILTSIVPKWLPRLTRQTDFERTQTSSNIVWKSEKVLVRAARVIVAVVAVWLISILTNFITPYSFANTSIFSEAKIAMAVIQNDQTNMSLGKVENIDFPPSGIKILNDNGIVVYKYSTIDRQESYALFKMKFEGGKWKTESTEKYDGNPNIGFSITKGNQSANVSN